MTEASMGFSSQVVLEWVAIAFSVALLAAKSLQSCPTLCDPIDGRPPGSPIPGILHTLHQVSLKIDDTGLEGGWPESRECVSREEGIWSGGVSLMLLWDHRL